MRLRFLAYVWCFVCLFGNKINAQDAIDPASVQVLRGPNVLQWRIGSRVTHVDLTPSDFAVTHSAEGTWPEAVPPGWTGPIQSTLYVVVKGADGQWRTTGSIEFWKGRRNVGGPLSDGLRNWWFRAPEIGLPHVGDVVGVFLAAGDQREKDVRTVEERTNIVAFTVPPNDSGSFAFDGTPAPPPTPPNPPPSGPPTPPNPPPAPSLDLADVLTRLDVLTEDLKQHEIADQSRTNEIIAAVNEPGWFKKVISSPYFQMVATAVATWLTTKELTKP